MDTTTPAEIREILLAALATHATRMKRDAALRGNAGSQLKDYRARLRAEGQRAEELATIISRVNQYDLAFLLNADKA